MSNLALRVLTAVVALPGIPSASIGIIVPPVTPLSQPSDAMTPSGLPVPHVSGFFERLRPNA